MNITSFDGVLVALFVLLPGVIASRTFRQSGSFRETSSTESRVGSVLAWAAVVGVVNAAGLSILTEAFRALSAGRWDWTVGMLPAFILLVPYVLGLAAGRLSRQESARELLKSIGLLSTSGRTPWDNLSIHESLWIEFREGERRYRGALERSDVDMKQILVTQVQEKHGDDWIPAEYSDALLLDVEKSVMWLYRARKSTEQPERPFTFAGLGARGLDDPEKE